MRNPVNNIPTDKIVVLMATYESGTEAVLNLLPYVDAFPSMWKVAGTGETACFKETDWCWVEVDGDRNMLVPRHLMGTQPDEMDVRVVELISKYIECVENGEFDENPLNELAEIAVETETARLICPTHECLGVGECDCYLETVDVYDDFQIIEGFYTQLNK